MMIFLKKVMYFIIGFLLMNLVFYYTLAKSAIFENYVFNTKGIESYDKFLISDSHAALMGNVPDQYGIFNFSYKGDNYLDMFLKVHYLIKEKELNSTDTIFLGVDNYTLSNYRNKSDNLQRNLIYIDYNYSLLDSKELKGKGLDVSYKKYLKRFPFLNIGFGDFYFRFINPSASVPKAKYSFSDLSDSDKISRSKKRFSVQFPTDKKDESQLHYLIEIMKLCKEHNVNLVGIKFPITDTYRKIVNERNYGADKEMISYGFKVLDYQNYFKSNDKVFFDQDHLNEKGAQLLSEKLKTL